MRRMSSSYEVAIRQSIIYYVFYISYYGGARFKPCLRHIAASVSWFSQFSQTKTVTVL
jgi:hypothetical protein